MSRKMVPVMSVKRWISALCLTAILIPLLGCATTPPIVTTPPIAEMAWVRTDGRKIADDPALLQQGRTDIAACNANLDTGDGSPVTRADEAAEAVIREGLARVSPDWPIVS